ncbi:MAG: 30S ribosomal protein S16 [Gammaproteobacteria bacterium]|nr:30S ribosomal protein S16 [Gammaproteobacteria bacterium]
MVIIRLARTGTVKRPYYQLVATEKAHPRNGRIIERLGFYNPIAVGAEPKARIDMARVNYWLLRGSACSMSAQKVIKRHGQKAQGVA